MGPAVDILARSPSPANMPFFGILLCTMTLMQHFTLAVNSAALSMDVQCSNGCTCQLYHHVSCANISLGDFPSQLPAATTQLQFSSSLLPVIPAGAFLNLSHLTTLYLSSNGIEQVRPGAFNGLSQLQFLHLNNNSIGALETGVFDDVTAVTFLYLDNNLIANLTPDVFSSLGKLNVIDLHNNRLTALLDQTFRKLPALRWLFLSNNHISAISPRAFRGNRVLRELYLDGNQLTTVPSYAIRSLRRLNILQLSNNAISRLSSNAFSQKLKFLQEVYLDNTLLEEVSPWAFPRLRALKVLSMRGNRLVTLSFSSAFQSIEQFGLSGNAWRCDCGLIWLRDWLLKQNMTGQSEVWCSTPSVHRGKPLVKVQTQYLTCPSDNLNTSTTSSVTTKDHSSAPQSTAHATPPNANGRGATPRANTFENPTPTNADPCLSERITEVIVSEITTSSLLVNWNILEDLGDEYELWYSTGGERQSLRMIGGVREVELGELQVGAGYRICVVPQSSLISKCTGPSDNQCTVAQTLGLPSNSEPVQSEGKKGQYALGAGITVMVILLIIIALIVVFKLRSSRTGFQRHYDEDACTYIENFEIDQSKMDFDNLDSAYDNAIDEGNM
ncbi:uncharacterized protein LOC144509175 [Mustelus asterias]